MRPSRNSFLGKHPSHYESIVSYDKTKIPLHYVKPSDESSFWEGNSPLERITLDLPFQTEIISQPKVIV